MRVGTYRESFDPDEETPLPVPFFFPEKAPAVVVQKRKPPVKRVVKGKPMPYRPPKFYTFPHANPKFRKEKKRRTTQLTKDQARFAKEEGLLIGEGKGTRGAGIYILKRRRTPDGRFVLKYKKVNPPPLSLDNQTKEKEYLIWAWKYDRKSYWKVQSIIKGKRQDAKRDYDERYQEYLKQFS